MNDYRNSRQISQSDLIIAKGLLTSGIKQIALKAAMFGKALHEAILEPEKFNIQNYPILQDTRNLKCFHKVTQALLQDEVLANLLPHGQKEQSIYWTEPNTGID